MQMEGRGKTSIGAASGPTNGVFALARRRPGSRERSVGGDNKSRARETSASAGSSVAAGSTGLSRRRRNSRSNDLAARLLSSPPQAKIDAYDRVRAFSG